MEFDVTHLENPNPNTAIGTSGGSVEEVEDEASSKVSKCKSAESNWTLSGVHPSKRHRLGSSSSSENVNELLTDACRDIQSRASIDADLTSCSSADTQGNNSDSRPDCGFDHNVHDPRRQRFIKTMELLKSSGLFDLTVKTSQLMRINQQLQKELDQLKLETAAFLREVLENPENARIVQMMSAVAQSAKSGQSEQTNGSFV